MKRVFFALLLIAFCAPGLADDSAHPVTVWKASGDTNTVYLLGSVHLLRPEDFPLPSVIDRVYDDADVLIMEIDMDDLNPIAAQNVFQTYGMLRDGQTLRDVMGDDLYAQAESAAEAIDIPLDMLSGTDPWYAAMTVEIMMLNRIGFDPSLGVEMYMLKKAGSDGKRIDGLETVEQQVRFLDNMSLPAQREMLLATLTESANIASLMDELISAWRHGDLATLQAGMLDEMEKHEELNQALIVDRNSRWVEQIKTLLDDSDDYLIIVGALHLIGDNGVPKLLQKEGIGIYQLSESPTLQ